MPKKAESPRDSTARTFLGTLSPRHRDWVIRAAQLNQETPGNLLERLVRMAYAGDHTKAGAVSRSGTVKGKFDPDA